MSEITQNGSTSQKTDQVSARTVILPNNFFAGYEALAVRLAGSAEGAEIPVTSRRRREVKMIVKGVTSETVQAPSGSIPAARLRRRVPERGCHRRRGRGRRQPEPLRAPRDSSRRPLGGSQRFAGVAARRQTVRNPTDVDVIIPAAGFNIAGTLTMPPGEGRLKHPTVVLVAGSGQVDRDEQVAGIPIFAQLAGALAEKGFMVLRYDKRGVGQSGGRTETVTLQDYADDVVGIVKWLAQRKDVDPRHIAVVGHSEGGSVAMLAGNARKEDRIARARRDDRPRPAPT